MLDKKIPQLRIGVVLAGLILSGLIFFLLPVAAFQWASRPFPGLMLDPNLIVSDSGASRWAGKQAAPPIAYPERVVAVDGIPVTENRQFQARLRGYEVGDSIALTLVQPSGSRVTPSGSRPERVVMVTLARFTNADMWNQFWLFYLAGLFVLFIGVWTFRARPHEEEAQLFALFSVFGALSIGAIFDLTTSQWFVRVWVFVLSMVGALGAWLSFVFPHETRLVRRWPGLKWLVPVPAVGVAIWGQLWLNFPSDLWAYAIPWRAAYFLNGFGLVTIWVMMAYRSVRTQSALVRQQSRLILAGSVFAFLPLIFFFLTASLGIHLPWLPPALYIPPVIIFPFIIGYVIVRYRLMNTGNVRIRRGVAYLIMTILLAVMLALIVVGLSASVGALSERPWLLAILMVGLVVLFAPIRDWLQAGIDQMVFRQTAAFDDLLGAYRRELTTAVHMDQVADVLLKYIRLGVPGAEARLFLPDHKTNCYTSYVNHSDVVINTASPLVDFMRYQNGAIDLAEELAWPDTFLRHRDTVVALDAAVVVPMSSRNELLGWVTLTPKSHLAKFQTSQLSYMNMLAEQTLLGLERANVVRRLENRVAELDLLTHFSQFLSFTVDFEDLWELSYTNFTRLLEVDDFFVVLLDRSLGHVYKVFHVEDGERISEREGRGCEEKNPHVIQVVESGQSAGWQDENGRFWFASPLNAGRDTLGAIFTTYRDPARTIRSRQQQLFSVFADRTAVALERLQSNQSLKRRAQQMEIMNQVTLLLTSTLELEPLLNLILDKAIELLDAEAGTFMLTVPDTGELEFRVVRGPTSEGLLGKRLAIGTGLAGTAAQTGRPVIVNNVQSDPRWFSKVDAQSDFQTNAILTMPLLRRNQVLGVLQVINKQDGAPFNDEDQSVLTSFAGQAVVAIENARLMTQTDRALRKSVDELSLLQQLDMDLNTTLDLGRILNTTLERMLGICKGTAGAIVLLDAEKRPYFLESRNYDNEYEIAVAKHPEKLAEGLVGKVIQTGKPQITGNVHEDKDYVMANFTTLSQMTLPLISKQELIGVVVIERDKLDAFDPYDVETAYRATNHAAIAIDNAILYEKVNEANQAKSEFVSMVSHELKTPMTAIRGYVDLMLSGMTGDLNEQQQNFLDTIAVNVRRMGQQIQDLTDISRIETNHLHMEFAPTELHQVVQETLQTVQTLADEKAIQIHLPHQLEKMPPVWADRSRLIQVFTNLLSNACKYSPRGTNVTLKLQKMEHGEDGPMIQCGIQDQGYGISAQDQEKLFTKFFRADDPNIRGSKGTGLGLSITKGIVELHGGQIWVESELGYGATFYFTIPQHVVS